MVLSLTDFDDIPFPNNTQGSPPICSPDSPETPSDHPPTTEATNEQLSQSPSLAVPALDPALLALSPPTPNHTTNPILHGQDMTQLARHLGLQKSLTKGSMDELVRFAKRPPGEQLIWIAATQLSMNESLLTAFSGEVSPTLLKHIKKEVGSRVLSSNLPAYRSEQVGFELVRDALLADQNSGDVSEEALKDADFCKKLKSAILTAWTKARSAIKTEIAQSLGDDPATEFGADGLPNRRPSSTSVSDLTVGILQAVPSAKGIRFSVLLAARVAFLRYCYTLSQSSGCDYWPQVDMKLAEIRETIKDPNAVSQKFGRILHVDQCTYGTAEEAKRPLADSAPKARRASGSAPTAGGKRKRS